MFSNPLPSKASMAAKQNSEQAPQGPFPSTLNSDMYAYQHSYWSFSCLPLQGKYLCIS